MSCSARARPKASGGVGSSWARMQDSRRIGRAPRPGARVAEDPFRAQAGPAEEEAEARRGRAQRARHDHEVAGLRAVAAQQLVAVTQQRDVDDERPRRRGDVAAHDGHSRLRRALEEAVVQAVQELDGRVRGKGEAHHRVARHAGHGRDVGQVDGEGLASDEVRRTPFAPEVHALDQDVRGDERERARLHRGRVVADADQDSGSEGDARPQVTEQAALTDVGHRGAAVEDCARAGVAHRAECSRGKSRQDGDSATGRQASA